jgi:lipase maturation factor 1
MSMPSRAPSPSLPIIWDGAGRGEDSDGRRSFLLGRWLFLKALGGVYLAAFLSFWFQARGLVGSRGILPASQYLESAHQALGAEAWWRLPSLFWLDASDAAVAAGCAAGVAGAIALLAGLAPRLACTALWVLYLSICGVGQIFLGYQWDTLLLEAGLLAIWLAPGGWRPRLGRAAPAGPAPLFLERWLVFRLFFLSGAVKLLSGDPTWRDLSAMSYHYWTQPIPTWTSALVYFSPLWVHQLETLATLAVELGLPLFVFGPRPARLAAAAGLVGLQLVINATGNYGFFGLLAVALCLPLVDDAAWRRLPGIGRLAPAAPPPRRPASRAGRDAAIVVAGFVVLVTGSEGALRLGLPVPAPAEELAELVAPLRSFNSYGLFAVMTTDRIEIEVEGSRDGHTWLPYEFRYKPDRVDQAPRFAPLHMPRLDWQMWFAALRGCARAPWFLAFQERLLEAQPEVLKLLAHDPLHGERPRYVRSLAYRYRFADPATRRRTGDWWEREELGPFCPTLTLEGGNLHVVPP